MTHETKKTSEEISRHGGLVTAVRTLSILPMPGAHVEPMASSLSWFAFVGFVLGLILYGISLLADLLTGGTWPEAVALMVVVGGILLTRGFHLDGLADWADAFGSISDRDRTLAIMKDSRVGTFGVLALVVVLMTKWVALARLVELDLAVWIVAACVVSRIMMVDLAVRLPYARPEGGTGASFVENARPLHEVVSLVSGLVLLLVVCGPAGVIVLAFGWIISAAFGKWCHRRIGGVTGDLLGACGEIVETMVLVFCAVLGERLTEFIGWEILFR